MLIVSHFSLNGDCLEILATCFSFKKMARDPIIYIKVIEQKFKEYHLHENNTFFLNIKIILHYIFLSKIFLFQYYIII